MGCSSSKVLDTKSQVLLRNGDFSNHTVFLTSTTYGALKLDPELTHLQIDLKTEQIGADFEGLEVIDTWELMRDLEDEIPISDQTTINPKLPYFRGGKYDRSPNLEMGKKLGGKENRLVTDPNRVLKPMNSLLNSSDNPRKAGSLDTYEQKCQPRGENHVVIYITTLRGIPKTFEDCNVVRIIIESHKVQLIERDVSMDCGFKEELRRLMGKREVKVPVVFVKGRLIGGANEVVKLEEEGKLEGLFCGVPYKSRAICEGCGGFRFRMCDNCNGSCRVLDEDYHTVTVRCQECNENGLLQCPLCC